MELPTVGQRVTGQVVWHADHNQQVGVMLSEWSWHENWLPRFAECLGQLVAGHITKVAPIGVFVRIADCVEGLVPFTEPVEDLAEAVREGQEISVQIIAVDLERSRVLLSAKLVSRSS
ncbi:S1 RNA-binding domain-containing protein [Streptomyces decoyicus]